MNVGNAVLFRWSISRNSWNFAVRRITGMDRHVTDQDFIDDELSEVEEMDESELRDALISALRE